MAIIPNCYKYRRPKGNSLKPKERKSYSKSYITFLKIACKVGIVKDFQLVDEYISITFTETFMKELSEPPYIKIPFGLLNDITTNNYQFIMYFINRLFSLKPSTPHFVNIKIKELLKVTGISTSTSQAMAVNRLNNYLGILEKYQVIHISGKNGFNPKLKSPKYAQFEYVDKELKDLMALSDVVISRAGSNSIFELATLNKPMILVPLPNTASRGEQSLNAKSFQKKGFGEIIKDEDIGNKDILFPMLEKVFNNKDTYIKNMQSNPVKTTSIEKLADEISSLK